MSALNKAFDDYAESCGKAQIFFEDFEAGFNAGAKQRDKLLEACRSEYHGGIHHESECPICEAIAEIEQTK